MATGLVAADIENSFDYNRDQRVNLSDVIFCRNNQSGFTPLNLIDLSSFSATVAAQRVELLVATELATGLVAADIENSSDQSRDERGNLGDVIFCRNGQSDFSPLNLIDLSGLSATVAAQRVESSPAEEWADEQAPAAEPAVVDSALVQWALALQEEDGFDDGDEDHEDDPMAIDMVLAHWPDEAI